MYVFPVNAVGISALANTLHTGAAPFVPVPVMFKNDFVAVVFGESNVVVSAPD